MRGTGRACFGCLSSLEERNNGALSFSIESEAEGCVAHLRNRGRGQRGGEAASREY